MNPAANATPIPLWASWNFEPLTLVIVLGVLGAYLYALGPLRRRLGGLGADAPVHSWQPPLFFGVMALLALGLFSPLETLGMTYSLTMHMMQHLLFSVVCPPLKLLATPGWMLTSLVRGETARHVTRRLTHPVVAFGLYNANMWLWHIPAVFDATPPQPVVEATWIIENLAVGGVLLLGALMFAPRLGMLFTGRKDRRLQDGASGWPQTLFLLAGIIVVIGLAAWGALDVTALTPLATLARTHNPLHVLMNLLFIGTALLYWAPILSPANEVAKRISPLFGMLYMFISTQPMMALGAILTFAAQPLYHTYDNAPLLWGFTRLGDQQLAGLTMWLVMDIPLIIVLSALFFRWVSALDRAERWAAGEYVEEAADDIFAEQPAVYPAEQELIWE